MRWSHKRVREADRGEAGGKEFWRSGVSEVVLTSPRPADLVSKGNLGSDIITGVVVR